MKDSHIILRHYISTYPKAQLTGSKDEIREYSGIEDVKYSVGDTSLNIQLRGNSIN